MGKSGLPQAPCVLRQSC